MSGSRRPAAHKDRFSGLIVEDLGERARMEKRGSQQMGFDSKKPISCVASLVVVVARGRGWESLAASPNRGVNQSRLLLLNQDLGAWETLVRWGLPQSPTDPWLWGQRLKEVLRVGDCPRVHPSCGGQRLKAVHC